MSPREARKARREQRRTDRGTRTTARRQARWNKANGCEDDGSGFATSLDSED